MGNRAALMLSPTTPPEAGADLAYGTNNFVAPFWFAAYDAPDLTGWREKWQALLAEEPPEDAYDATTLWVPWPVAETRLAAAAARVAALDPAPDWAPLFIAWQEALRRLAAGRGAAWLGMGLTEIFAFHEDPDLMVREARDTIALWRGEGPIALPPVTRDFENSGFAEHPDLRPATGTAPVPPPIRPGIGRQQWLLLPCFAVITAGCWFATGSVLFTAMTGVVLAWSFMLILRQRRP